MNVKAGDLAYIVNDPHEGRTVTVERFVGPVRGSIDIGPHWVVSASWEMELDIGDYSNTWVFPDSRLRPISGVPVADDVKDDIKEPA